ALSVRRTGTREYGAVPNVARTRNETRNPSGAAMNDLSMRAHKLRGYVSHAADLRSGKLSPRTYLEETLNRIAQLDKTIGAFVTINRDGARQAADDSAKRDR